MGLFDWLKRAKTSAISDELWAKTVAGLPFLANLAVDEQKSLKLLAEQFLAEKEFSTAGGLQLSDEICVAIAAQGCLPILHLGLAAYRDWVGIIVYADEFVVPRQVEDENGSPAKPGRAGRCSFPGATCRWPARVTTWSSTNSPTSSTC
jgi:Mlc titration factor MtfA (ptsG expression regulator)